MGTYESAIIREVVAREDCSRLYNIKLNGYTVFNFIKRQLRQSYISSAGLSAMDLVSSIKKTKVIESFFISSFQLGKLLLSMKKYDNVFFAFPRLESIGGLYVDKFTDPFIVESGIKDFIIFENGRGGVHMRPRYNDSHIVNTDILTIVSVLHSSVFWRFWYLMNKKLLDGFIKELVSVYGENVIDKGTVLKSVLKSIHFSRLIETVLRSIHAKNVFAPARPFDIFAATRHLGIRSFEMQHGITYSETALYSGYQHGESIPDYFLSFGEMSPKDVYGINPDKVINVGWPLFDFCKCSSGFVKYHATDVLVISEPEVSDKIIDATLILAKAFPDSRFYIRPHPHETYNNAQSKLIHLLPNVSINNNKVNIAEAMAGFENVVGENSTVLYEALACNKKVGKLYLSGLEPIYLEEKDKESFWEIHSIDNLKQMLYGSVDDKNQKSIYSKFDAEKFLSLLR